MKHGMQMAMAVLAMAATAWAQAPAADGKEGVALTVYNGGFGVVRETRSLEIAAGGLVKFGDVAQYIDPTSVHFKSLTEPDAKLLEQNYQFDLVSADKLLQKYVDKPIEVITEGNKAYSGTLMSFDAAQLVLQEEKGLVMVQRPQNVKDIRFKALPEGLLTKPTLLWKVAADKVGPHLVEVTYQTGGLSWHAEYVLVLNPADTAGDLTGWVSVENNSGKAYTDAKLKFIAGDVRRIQPQQPQYEYARRAEKAGMGGAAMEEKAFFEYHMYTLARPSTVADKEVKQLEMFAPVREMKVTKRYLYNPLRGWRWGGGRHTEPAYGVTSDKKVNVFVEFKNEKASGLGLPLPAGKVRVYKQDPADKALEFVGEEQIDHTPVGQELSLLIGNAFDIVGERKQTSFAVDAGGRRMTESFEIKLSNSKAEDVVVRVKEPMFRWSNSRITKESAEHLQLDAFTAAWDLKVPAMKDDKPGEAVLTYTVEYVW